jgi:Zn-dependent protease
MPIISFQEILYAVILTVVLGYIFSGFVKRPVKDPYERLLKPGMNWEDLKFAMIISAPAVILHEMGHKFIGLALGIPSTFHIFWSGLGLGVLLKIINAPFLILAPGYVSIGASATPLQHAGIAAAGPLVNLALWLGAAYYLKTHKNLKREKMMLLAFTAQINKILFIFNLIPFGPLDGAHVLSGILSMF